MMIVIIVIIDTIDIIDIIEIIDAIDILLGVRIFTSYFYFIQVDSLFTK